MSEEIKQPYSSNTADGQSAFSSDGEIADEQSCEAADGALNEAEEFSAETDGGEQNNAAPVKESAQSGGTDGAQKNSDGVCAAAQPKKNIRVYLICAAIAFGGIYFPQIFNLLRPLFGKIYYGNLNNVLFMCCCVAFYIPFIIVYYLQVKKRTGIDVFRMGKGDIPLKRSLIIYAIALATILTVSAALGFNLKIVADLGKKVTRVKVITNASNYGYGAVKLIMALFVIEMLQEAGEILFKHKFKYGGYIPYGSIVTALTFGFAEAAVSYALKTATVFVWVNIAFVLLYGVIYVLSNKRFTITYFVSLIIYIL